MESSESSSKQRSDSGQLYRNNMTNRMPDSSSDHGDTSLSSQPDLSFASAFGRPPPLSLLSQNESASTRSPLESLLQRSLQEQSLPQQQFGFAGGFMEGMQQHHLANNIPTGPSRSLRRQEALPLTGLQDRGSYSIRNPGRFESFQQQEQIRPTPIRRQLNERELFMLFIKLLFRLLERADNPRLRPRAKALVSECVRRNRMGELDYTPLSEAVENRLRGVVGEKHWIQAKTSLDNYCRQRGLRPVAAV